MKKLDTQCQIILKHLEKKKTITTMQAFELYKITRLSGRIYDLRARGYQIEKTMKKSNAGARYAEYRLVA